VAERAVSPNESNFVIGLAGRQTTADVIDVRLIGRGAEKQALGEMLDSVRGGRSRALVLRGEPGIGKSALLGYAVAHADDMQVIRMVAVESENHLGFAAVHRLLMPFLPALDRISEPQRRALSVAFGLVSGPHADPFLVGLAALTLLSDAAEARPVLCVIDDAQWLDDESSDVLGFVARRLLADRVGLLFAARETADLGPHPQALPQITVHGLPDHAAYELLKTSVTQPIDPVVAAHLVTETGGNPLAVVEAARELTPDQRSGAVPLPEPLPVGHRLEESFLRRVRELPPDTQALLLLAAAGPPGQGDPLWRAAADIGIAESAGTAAEAAGLMTFWPEVRFAHPLVRSAVYHAATAAQRRQAHLALATASELDPVSRAWHLAAAAARRDEKVAAEVESAADETRRRGGHAATAVLLERAAQLTPDPERRAERVLAAAQNHLLAGTVDRADALLEQATPGLRNAKSSAEAAQLQGRIAATRGRVAEATAALVDAARRLRRIDPLAARDTLLSALESAAFAGWAQSTSLLGEIAEIARDLLSAGAPPDSAPTLLLQGYTARLSAGYAAGVAPMCGAITAFLRGDADPDVALRHLELTAISAADLLDETAVERLTRIWIDTARQNGALARLAGALAFRSAFVDAPSGRLSAAQAANAEASELGQVTHNLAIVPPTGAHLVITLALAGNEVIARETAAAVAREAPSRGAAGEAAFAAYALGVLEISLGNYASAVRCLEPAYLDGTPLTGTQALPDLVEASVRSGQRELAESALQRLAERASASATPLALGLLARSQALVAGSDDARDGYEEALRLLGGTRALPQLARTHLLYGEWLRRQRLRREARDQLRAAVYMFESTGLEAFAERSRVELRATGERVRKKVLGDPEELTPREAQIATLVSEGEGNRQIAAQLFVSPSTVEYHLHKVFRKTGVTSRTQLARHVSSRGSNAGKPAIAGSVG
jgi:DNA-binding CsgD family transcriptional regulator